MADTDQTHRLSPDTEGLGLHQTVKVKIRSTDKQQLAGRFQVMLLNSTRWVCRMLLPSTPLENK